MSLRTHRGRVLVAVVTVPLLIAAGLAAGTTTATASTPDPGGKSTSRQGEALDALADARAVLSGSGPVTGGPSTRDATMTLLRLAQLRSSLTGADAAAAARLLARPGATASACTASNCYHWTTSGADAVSTVDNNTNGKPDYVDAVMATVDGVRSTYVNAGYRTPDPDGSAGGNAKTDIYLGDVGAEGLYGYCTTDQPNLDPPPYNAWAFCVLDNDYSPSQFSTNTPLENLQVTAAHEYFHAVQFAYDAFEDSWFLEATATWAEDELYDDVDDNLQYLARSPLSQPGRPLDTWANDNGPDSGAQYGEWIFFRFLSENISAEEGGMPTIVRDMWERADGAAGGPDDYSIQAVDFALAARGVDGPGAFRSFAAANRLPAKYYEEGADNHYPVAPPDGKFKLSTSKKDSGWKVATVNHLAAVTARFLPGTGLSAKSWNLKLALDLPPRETETMAVVTVVRKTGGPIVSVVPLDSEGGGAKKVPFGSSAVSYVEVTLINAGMNYNCWEDTRYSCQGISLDDGRKLMVRAKVVK